PRTVGLVRRHWAIGLVPRAPERGVRLQQPCDFDLRGARQTLRSKVIGDFVRTGLLVQQLPALPQRSANNYVACALLRHLEGWAVIRLDGRVFRDRVPVARCVGCERAGPGPALTRVEV